MYLPPGRFDQRVKRPRDRPVVHPRPSGGAAGTSRPARWLTHPRKHIHGGRGGNRPGKPSPAGTSPAHAVVGGALFSDLYRSALLVSVGRNGTGRTGAAARDGAASRTVLAYSLSRGRPEPAHLSE